MFLLKFFLNLKRITNYLTNRNILHHSDFLTQIYSFKVMKIKINIHPQMVQTAKRSSFDTELDV